MKTTGWMTLIYALLIFLGGIFGYVKAGSVASLIMGVGFAAILGISAFIMFNGKKYGWQIAVAATSLLTLFFIYRFAISFKFMPAGLMSVISIIVLALLLFRKTNGKQ